MEKKLYTIESRYEMWTRNGIKWTQWFPLITITATEDISSLENTISIYKKQDKQSKQKLKHEYRIALYVHPEPIQSTKEKKKTKNSRKKKSDA